MEKQQNGFFRLTNTLRKYKRAVTDTEIIKRAIDEGWYNQLRLGYNSITRQLNRHNEKYGGQQFEYVEH